MKIRISNELVLIDALVVLFAIICAFFPTGMIRIILGLPFVLFFPGYTLVMTLFPRRSQLSNIERVALSFGLSIAVVPIFGFILNYTPWGLRLYSLLISLTIFILGCSLAAWYERRRLPEAEKPDALSFNIAIRIGEEHRLLNTVLYIILITAVVGAMGTAIYIVIEPKTSDSFTEFYIVPSEGERTGYPTELRVNEEGKTVIEITNHEKADTSYEVEVRIDGVKNNRLGPIILSDGQEWQQTISFMPSKVGDGRKIEMLLYKNREEEPYRELHFWINVKG